MSEKPLSKSAHLQTLIHRRDKVLAVLHPPTAAHARIMEKAGCEALFTGTGGVVGAYTGLADVGTATMPDRMAENLLMFIRQNKGTLSKKRRAEEFKKLRDDEVASLELIVRDAFEGFEGADIEPDHERV